MKKILIVLTIVISCIGISKVSADTIDYVHSDILKSNCDYYYVDYDNVKSLGYEEQLQEVYNMLLEEYNKNFSTQYSYYYLHFVIMDKQNCNQTSEPSSIGSIQGFLNLYTDIPTLPLGNGDSVLSSSYNVDSKTYITPSIISGYYYPWLFDTQYNPLSYFTSNFDLINDTDDSYVITGNSNFTINPGDIIKPYYSSDNVFQDNFTEINLNDYAYIALTPKEFYSDETVTTVYVKGQYCLTPVYNYGLRERNDVLSGTKMQRCSVAYNEYTPVRTYLLKQDMQNKAIYYVKAYNTNIENKIKVDNTIFDITYIKEEDKDNPYVYIQGKYYPTIPYDNLTDTATKSEEEEYNAGSSCAVGDLNCQAQYSSSFSDIFDAPLEFLEDIWDSIVSVFDLIVKLITLLPDPLENFLYLSFTLAIIIGLIKLIIG